MRISDWSSDVCSSDLFRDIVVEALGVVGIVGIGGGDAREQILIGFAGQQIAVLERFLAEIGEQRVAARVDLDIESAGVVLWLGVAVTRRLPGRFLRGIRLFPCQISRLPVSSLNGRPEV